MKDCLKWKNGDVYVNKCKDCKYFKDDCEFASVNKQLGLDGNFVASSLYGAEWKSCR